MRYEYSYSVLNHRHNPVQSPKFRDLETAITWAADAAAACGYHSKISCTCTSLPDAEYGDRVLDVQTNEIGAVRAGERTMLSRYDCGYPNW